MGRTRWAATATLAAVDAAVLVAVAPTPARLAADVAAPHDWFARAGVDGAVATLAAAALWLVALWVAVGLAAAAATRLPGTLGRGAATVCRLVLPRVARNVLVGSAGLGVLLAPVAAGAAVAPAPLCAVSAGRAPVPAPTWPATSVPAPTWPATSVPAPTWPGTSVPTTAPNRAAPRAPHRTAAPAPASRTPPPAVPGSPAVTVRPGDSLWLIAAHRLGPQATAARIARSWPRWYAANRDVVGDDPAVIAPGEVLHAPLVPTEEDHR